MWVLSVVLSMWDVVYVLRGWRCGSLEWGLSVNGVVWIWGSL